MKDKTTDKSVIYNIIQKLKFESANTIFYGSAILTIAYLFNLSLQNPPEALLAIATGIGVESISSIIQRLKSNEKIDEKEIIETVKKAIKDSGIESELQKNEFKSQISEILQNLDFIKYYTQEGEYKLAAILAEQYSNHNLIVEIQQDLKTLREAIKNLARKDQSEEIISLLRTLIKSEENSNDISSNQLKSNQLKEIEEHYLSWLVRQHNRLDLRGIKEAGSIPTIPLEQVYVALRGINSSPAEREESKREIDRHLDFENLKLPPLEYRQRRSEFLANAPWMMSLNERDRTSSQDHSKQERMNLGEVFQKYRWLVLLGDPGSGKTTLVRWLTLRLAQAYLAKQNQISVPANQVEPKAKETDSPIELGTTRLPILLRVSEYAEAKNNDENLLLIDFLGDHGWMGKVPTYNHNSPKCGEKIPPELLNELFKHALKEQQAVVFLDGLDELSENTKRENIVAAIESFIHDWIKTPDGFSPFDDLSRPWELSYSSESPLQQGGNQIIITSRIAGYHDSPLSGYVPHYTIEAMQPEAINQFCDAWTLAVHKIIAKPDAQEKDIEQKAQKQASSLKDAIHLSGNTSVAEMASNPLLLTILAMIHHTTKASLPERRIDLYQKAVKILIEEWRESGLNEDEVLYILGPIAEYIHENYQSGLIPIHVLKEKIKIHYACYKGYKPQNIPLDIDQQVEQFIKTLQEKIGIIAGRGEEYYGFLHLTFQEYFAARQLVRDEIGAQKRLLDRIHNSRWREPIILALAYATKVWGIESREKLLFGLLESEDQISDIYPHAPLLIADCIPEMVSVPGRLISPLAEMLLEIYSDHQGRGQYKDLQQRIETAFHQLRNEKNEHHCFIVDQILVKAIKTPVKIHSNSRYAAAQLIYQFNWHSPTLAEALVEVYPDDSEEWNWSVDRARRQLANNFPSELPKHLLPLRQLLLEETKYVEEINNNFVLQQIFLVLCNGQMEITFNPSKIACEPFLANDLIKILNKELDIEDWSEQLSNKLFFYRNKNQFNDSIEIILILVITENYEKYQFFDYHKKFINKLKYFSELQLNWRSRQKDKIEDKSTTIITQLEALIKINNSIRSLPNSNDQIPKLTLFLANQPDILSQIIKYAISISRSDNKNNVLNILTPQFDENPDLISQTIKVFSSNFRDFEEVLLLAPFLADYPNRLYEIAMSELSRINSKIIPINSLMTPNILRTISLHLSKYPELFSQVVTYALNMPESTEKAEVLSIFAAQLTEHPESLTKITSYILSMRDSENRVFFLLSITPYLNGQPKLLSRVMETVLSMKSELFSFLTSSRHQDEVSGVAPQLAKYPEFIAQVLTFACAKSEFLGNTKIPYCLIPYLADYPENLSQVMKAVFSMSNKFVQIDVVKFIIPNLAKYPELISQALKDMNSITTSDFFYPEILEMLALQLAQFPNLFYQYMMDEFSISDSFQQFSRLRRFAPQLKEYPNLLSHFITDALSISNSIIQAEVLSILVPQLSENQDILFNVISIAFSMQNTFQKAHLLSIVTSKLSKNPDLRLQIIKQVIKIAPSISDIEKQADVLSSLVPQLTENPDLHLQVIKQVIKIAPSISDIEKQADMLISIVPQLTENPDLHLQVIEQVIKIASEMTNDEKQEKVLISLAPQLSEFPDVLSNMIKAVLFMTDNEKQEKVLNSVIQQFNELPDLMSIIVSTAFSSQDMLQQSNLLTNIAPFLIKSPILINKVWIFLYQQIIINVVEKKFSYIYSGYSKYLDWGYEWDPKLTDDSITKIKTSRELITIPSIKMKSKYYKRKYSILKEILPNIRFESFINKQLLRDLKRWLRHRNKIIMTYSALILAENGYFSVKILNILEILLKTDNERTIYRIQLALMPETPFKLRQIGKNTLIKLEELKIQADENDDFLSSTILYWTFQNIIFDDPEIYRELLNKLLFEEDNSIEETILNSSNRLSEETLELLLSTINEMMDSPKVKLLLEILANFLKHYMVNTEKITYVKNLLNQLLKLNNDMLTQSVLNCYSMITFVKSEDINLLKSLINNKTQRNQAIETFGFLLRNGSTQQKQDGLDYLVNLYKNPEFLNSRKEILANWVKIHISQRNKYDAETYTYEILDLLTDIEKTDNRIILESLIHAGTNYFGWGIDYHQKIVEISEKLIRNDSTLVSFLIENMSQSLHNQNVDSWPRTRILLGIGVAVAKNMPEVFKQKAKPYSLIELLIKATKNLHSFNVRRFAFTILSHLEEFTAVMIPALIRGISDVERVHQDTLIAVTRFQKIDDAALPKLTEELYHQRATIAYAIGKCLVSIGENPKTSVDQRKFIRRELRNAVRDKRSKRPVYILKDREIVYLGELDHLFYTLFSDFIEGRKNN